MTAGKPDFEEVPVLFVEASPEGPIRKRRFIAIQHGEVFDVGDDERAEWQVSGLSAKGLVVHVFEVMEARS
jgi:hypothetical protein